MGRPIQSKYFGAPKGTGVGGEGVASVAVSGTNNDYEVVPSLAVGAPNIAGGTQATAEAVMGVSVAAINAGGTLYTVGDVLTLVGGTGTAATITVSTVDAPETGVITGVTITTAGDYTAIPTDPVSVTGGTGSDATFDLTYKINSVTVTEDGAGYTSAPSVTPTPTGNATLTAALTTGTQNAINVSAWVVDGSSAVAGDIVVQKGTRSYKVTTAQGTSICKLVTGTPGEGEMTITATRHTSHSKYSVGATFKVSKLTAHFAYDEDGYASPWTFSTASGEVVSIANR